MYAHHTGVYVIAEVGGNHEQDLETIKRYIAEAAACGANAVKFQTLTPERVAAEGIALGENPQGYKTLRDVFRTAGLLHEQHWPAIKYCQEHRVDFLSTPFSVYDAQFLVEACGLETIKVASGDLTFTPLLEYLDTTRVDVILSTGMATLEEIAKAVALLQRRYWQEQVTVLHCVSAYPCPVEAINLRSITTLRQSFPAIRRFGLSDHTTSASIPAFAVALEATVIEKHFRLEGHHTRIDGPHALAPDQFAWMVDQIRLCEQALGKQGKSPHALEANDRNWARRGSDDLRPVDSVRPKQSLHEG